MLSHVHEKCYYISVDENIEYGRLDYSDYCCGNAFEDFSFETNYNQNALIVVHILSIRKVKKGLWLLFR